MEQLSLALDVAPRPVRRRVRELPEWPRVALSIRLGGTLEGVKIVTAAEAWAWPEVEISTPNSWPALVVDVRGGEALQRVLAAEAFGEVRRPSWHTVSADGVHVAWGLVRPVLHGRRARRSPMRALARVAEWYVQALQADRGYLGDVVHNPVLRPHRTGWGRATPYSLGELAEVIPLGWRRPRPPRSAVARRVAVWEAVMTWAGREANAGVEVLAAAMAANQELDRPLSPASVRSIARWVEEARRRWIAEGWHSDAFRERQAERGRKGGRKSKRGLVEQQRPWQAAGISRRTWYRRRARSRGQLVLDVRLDKPTSGDGR